MRALRILLILSIMAIALLSTIPATSASNAKWTIMVYLDGDNDLEAAALIDLKEMEYVGSTDEVNIIVLVDRAEDYYEEGLEGYLDVGSWSDTRIYYVVRDTSSRIGSRLIKSLGERDMGDPDTLRDFIKYTVSNYPADHYMLVIWDHGSYPGFVALDYSHNDMLTGEEINQALREAGIHLDIIAFDACLVSTIEMVYEVMDYGDYMTASEEIEPAPGYPYDEILSSLASNPSMTPRELAVTIVNKYYSSLVDSRYGSYITLAAIDLKQIKNVIPLFRDFVEVAYDDIEALRLAREGVDFFGGGVDPSAGASQIDLISFLKQVSAQGGVLGNKAENLANAVENAVVEFKAGTMHRESHGMSIYFPLRYNRTVYEAASRFGSDTGWSKVLEKTVNVNVNITVAPGESYTVNTTDIASELNLTRRYLDLDIVGTIDFDGDGAEELVVIADGYGDQLYTVLMMLKYYNDSNKLLLAYNDTVFNLSYDYMLSVVDAFGRDVDDDGMDELFIVLTASDQYNNSVTIFFRYDYKDGYVYRNGNYIMNLDSYSAALGDFDDDGLAELVLAGTYYDEDYGEYFSELFIVDTSSLEVEDEYYVESNENTVSEITDIAGGYFSSQEQEDLVVGVNDYSLGLGGIADYAGELYVIRLSSGELQVLEFNNTSGIEISALELGDIDSDNQNELLVLANDYYASTHNLTLYEWDNGLKILDQAYMEPGRWYPFEVGAFDIDGDGIVEILLYLVELDEGNNPVGGTIDIYSWLPSDKTFNYEASIDVWAENFTIPVPIDLNGDGLVDMVYVTQYNGTINVSIGKIENYVDPTGLIIGRIIDSQGRPAYKANVTILIPHSSRVLTTQTDQRGYFIVRVAAGTYLIEASWINEGIEENASAIVRLSPEENLTLTLRLKPAGPLPTTTTTSTTSPIHTATTTSTTTTTTRTATTTSSMQSQTTQTTTQTTTSTQIQSTTTTKTSPTTHTITSPTTTTPTTFSTTPSKTVEPGILSGINTYLVIVAVIIIVIAAIAGIALSRRKKRVQYPPPPPPPPPPPQY